MNIPGWAWPFLIYLNFWAVIMVHLLAHRLAGWALRLRLFHTANDAEGRSSNPVWRFLKKLGLAPTGNDIFALPYPWKPWRLRFAIFTIAGPLSSALIAYGAMTLAARLERGDPERASLTSSIGMIAGAVSLATAWPYRYRRGNGWTESDGMQLTNLLTQGDTVERIFFASFCINHGGELCSMGESRRGIRWIQRGIREPLMGDNPELQLFVAHNFLLQGAQSDRALAIYRRLLETPAVLENEELFFDASDGLASLALYQDRRDLFEEAERVLRTAMERSPQATTLKGTLGALRYEQGDFDSAWGLLQEVHASKGSDIDQAISAAYLAALAAREGRMAAAREFAAEAKEKDGTHLHVRRVLLAAHLND
jgi:tetratricopeptide (TPR) repeat protein